MRNQKEITTMLWVDFLIDEKVHEVNGMLCGIQRFMFTYGLLFGLDASVYEGRFCFNNITDAREFLNNWDGKTYPVVGVDGCTAIKGILKDER